MTVDFYGKTYALNKMSITLLGIIYAVLFIIVGTFLAVYVDVLMKPKSLNLDTAFRYIGAVLFIIIIIGSIISWLLDCTFNVHAGLPTFGLEERIQVIG
jgi:tryptophan-rich sensory protein